MPSLPSSRLGFARWREPQAVHHSEWRKLRQSIPGVLTHLSVQLDLSGANAMRLPRDTGSAFLPLSPEGERASAAVPGREGGVIAHRVVSASNSTVAQRIRLLPAIL